MSLRTFVPYIVLAWLVLSLVGSPAHGMKPSGEYGDNQCELIAKDVCKEYESCSLVWIQPLTSTGAFDFGDYNAHIINKIYTQDRGVYFLDYQSNSIMQSIGEINEWYYFYSGGKNAQVYDLAIERPSWGMKWHY